MTYKEIIYSVLDLLKVASDDAYFTEEHVLFLASKIRSAILKQTYASIKKEIPESNYQTICLDLIEVPAISGEPCEGGTYLRSKQKIPTTLTVGNTKIYPVDYYQGEITFISRERMRYVGHNKWLQNIIYASLGPDGYLYFKSSNPQYLYLEQVRMNAVFEDVEEAAKLQCDSDATCDILDSDFPLEQGLVSTLIETTVKFLSGSIYKPTDSANDASDNLAELATYLRNNLKSDLQKQIEG
jgi:hypothetical protein